MAFSEILDALFKLNQRAATLRLITQMKRRTLNYGLSGRMERRSHHRRNTPRTSAVCDNDGEEKTYTDNISAHALAFF